MKFIITLTLLLNSLLLFADYESDYIRCTQSGGTVSTELNSSGAKIYACKAPCPNGTLVLIGSLSDAPANSFVWYSC